MRRGGADPDLLVQLSDGRHVVIAMSWTDYATADDEETQFTSAPPLLDMDGLRQVAQLIKQIGEEGRAPAFCDIRKGDAY